MKLAVTVTVTVTGEDGSQCPVSGELAAALAAPVEQFSQMLTWAAGDAGAADHGDRETEIAKSGRELQRQMLEATFTIDAGCEDRIEQVTSAAGFGTAPSRKAMTGAWCPSSGRSVRPGWRTATAGKRTCTRPMPGGCSPMTRTRWGCARWWRITCPINSPGQPAGARSSVSSRSPAAT